MRQFLAVLFLFSASAALGLASVDTQLLNLVPANTKIIAAVDVERARNSDFGQYLMSRIDHEDEHVRQFMADTGFDPRRDLQDFMFAGTGPTTNGETGFAVLARGVFNPARIKATAKAKGGAVQSYEGVDVIVDERNSSQASVAFLDPSLAIMADTATLKQIIKNRGTPSLLDPALAAQVQKVGDQNDAWFVSVVPGGSMVRHLDREAREHLENARALAGILASSGGIRFGPLVTVTFDAQTRSPQDAVALADATRFFASMVQTQRQNDARAAILASALDEMTLTTAGDNMHLLFSISEKNLEQLAELGPGRMHAGTRPRPQ